MEKQRLKEIDKLSNDLRMLLAAYLPFEYTIGQLDWISYNLAMHIIGKPNELMDFLE
jgi:hypothetical protein